MAPIARGLGFAVVCVGLFLAFFYNVVVSWAIWYLIASFNPNLDWIKCGHWYNSPNCWSVVNQEQCEATGQMFWNNTCSDLATVMSHLEPDNDAPNKTVVVHKLLANSTSASAEYFERFVLGNRGHDWYNFGHVRWQNVACLAAAWILVALCLLKGVKTSGKVVYFTSLFPYAVLILLACRGFTLPGAIDGISYYLSPDWSRLASTEVWVDAATQVIFSLGPACGCVITLSSYNRFDRNCHKDAVLVALSNSVTSLFSGLVVFSILGFMAHESDKDVKDVISPGPGLAFIVYPEVVSRIPGSQIWAALFFLMLITLALGSIFGAFETVITALSDQWPALRAFKPQVVLSTSFIMLVLGLPFCCNGGIHMFTLFNASAPSWNLLLFAFLEVVLVSWVYGVDKFLENLSEMDINLPAPVKFYWKFSWKFTTPSILLVLLLCSWYDFGHVGYNGVAYPFWVQILGYMITGCTLIALPIVGCCEVVKRYPDTTEVFSSLLRPTAQWGPNHYQACESSEDRLHQSLP
jgi:solute carrier family 6 amino acid transporter-like protein 5/7/9/14